MKREPRANPAVNPDAGEQYRQLSRKLKELNAAAVLMLAVMSGCLRKADIPVNTVPDAEGQVAAVAVETPGNIKASLKTDVLKDEVDKIVEHVKEKVKEAKASGKVPLVHLLESHYDRDVLAKETAVMIRLRDELGIKDMQTEMPQEVRDSAIETTRSYQKMALMARTMQSIIDGTHPQSRQVSAARKLDMQEYIDGSRNKIQNFLTNTYDAVVLADMADANGIKIIHTDSLNDPAVRNNPNHITVEESVRLVKTSDTRLLGKLKENPTARILVTGQLHGKTVTEGTSDYAVLL